jgi:hypothetical protein
MDPDKISEANLRGKIGDYRRIEGWFQPGCYFERRHGKAGH